MSLVTTTYQRRTGLVWRWFRGSVIVLGDSDVYQTLGGAAALVWSLLDEAMSVTEIIDAAMVFGPHLAGKRLDIDELVQETVEMLSTSGLITSSTVERW